MKLTFIEAFEQYGRNSLAISEAMEVHESEAYNLMAARVERVRAANEHKRIYNRDRDRAIREHARCAG